MADLSIFQIPSQGPAIIVTQMDPIIYITAPVRIIYFYFNLLHPIDSHPEAASEKKENLDHIFTKRRRRKKVAALRRRFFSNALGLFIKNSYAAADFMTAALAFPPDFNYLKRLLIETHGRKSTQAQNLCSRAK